MSDQTVAARRQGLLARFTGLVSTPAVAPKPAAPPEPTREERLADVLQPWVKNAPPAFFAELDRMFAEAHTVARSQIGDHATTAFWLGFEAALERIAEKFNDWRG